MQESGEISRLKIKWWKEMRGGGACAGVSLKFTFVRIIIIMPVELTMMKNVGFDGN